MDKVIRNSLILGVVVGISHGATHYLFGNPATFVEAAVTKAGVVVSLVSALGYWALHKYY